MKTALLFLFSVSCVMSCQNADSGKQPSEQQSSQVDSSVQNPAEDTLTPHETNKAGETEFDWTPESVARQETTPALPSASSKTEPVLPQVSSQSFTFDATQEQILTLKGGTLLGFETGAFEQNGKKLTGPVTIEVKEYTQLGDFLADGMSTVSNGQLLETGGSLEVKATSNGKSCSLSPDKPMRIAFRRNKEVEGMETYIGNRTGGRINWVREVVPASTKNPEQEFTDGSDQTAERRPLRANEILERDKLREYLFTHLQSPPFLREFIISGQCDLEIETDENGCFRSACVRKSVHA
ncbi:MAG TPA: hypothetical protein PK509_12915, partial [Catalimonadaceae bacterium]|nr:hypothetical protein [Catalimonadaceae bacterium]